MKPPGGPPKPDPPLPKPPLPGGEPPSIRGGRFILIILNIAAAVPTNRSRGS